MRKLIKILIALSFILGSYFLGYYQAYEKYSSQLKELNEKYTTGQLSIQHFKDSISNVMKITNQSCSSPKDSLNTKTKISESKKKKGNK